MNNPLKQFDVDTHYLLIQKGLCTTKPSYALRLFSTEELVKRRAISDICDKCSVQSDCLTYALTFEEEHHIWGGTTQEEREHLTYCLSKLLYSMGTERREDAIAIIVENKERILNDYYHQGTSKASRKKARREEFA
jgi:hypothetical protein